MNTLIKVTVPGVPVEAQITRAQVRDALEVSGFRLKTKDPSDVPGEERWDPPGGDGSTWAILSTMQKAPSVVAWLLGFAVEELARFHGVTPGAMLREVAGAAIGEWVEKPGGDPDVTLHVLRYADGAHAAIINPTDDWTAFGRDCRVIGSGGVAKGADIEEAKRQARLALVGRKLAPQKMPTGGSS